MWEFDISPANWKYVKFVSEMDCVLAQCINSLKIAVIIYKMHNKFSWYDVDQRNRAVYATVELH